MASGYLPRCVYFRSSSKSSLPKGAAAVARSSSLTCLLLAALSVCALAADAQQIQFPRTNPPAASLPPTLNTPGSFSTTPGTAIPSNTIPGATLTAPINPYTGSAAVAPFDPKVKVDGTPMTGGFISIQAETAPIDFRKIELLNLQGCTDPKASNYKKYIVKSDPSMCRR